ncbi:hypothetical protein Pyn_21535 [Prunus yedoensis var. nudiflora]|uniref:Uncharacterized protein n=1 Tax=Prunus yedoensis var. nudiflora TaxID=2094558 RepID=A0A314ZEZ7_PRUYE|nr:hypothetical protein Pyn_21535 [Prunus yedoensis var. nudiflora]
MATSGEPYMMMFKPAQMNPSASIRVCPCNASQVAKMAAARKPTSKVPIKMAVFA